MKYIGFNEVNNQPFFHCAKKDGTPLCGAEVHNHYIREGLPNKYFLCQECQKRRNHTLPHTEWTQEKLAAYNIRQCIAANINGDQNLNG